MRKYLRTKDEKKDTEDIVVTKAVSNSMFVLLYEFSIFKVATIKPF